MCVEMCVCVFACIVSEFAHVHVGVQVCLGVHKGDVMVKTGLKFQL